MPAVAYQTRPSASSPASATSTNPRGQVEVESKDDMRKRGVTSPDRAESLMLCYAEPFVSPSCSAGDASPELAALLDKKIGNLTPEAIAIFVC